MDTWIPQHHWAAMALQATTADQRTDLGWRRRVIAVADPQLAHGNPDRVARRFQILLSRMRQQTAPGVPRWDDQLQVLAATEVRGPGDTTAGDLPVLAAGAPQDAPLTTLLLGFEATDALLGLVCVERGYLTGVAVAGVDGSTQTAHVWRPGGPHWPEDQAGGQAAVAAFACDRDTGHCVVMGHRVSTATHPLTAAEEERIVDLEPDGTPLGQMSLTENAAVVLAAACGRGVRVPEMVELEMPTPGWVVGRWWLHQVLTAVEGAALASAGVPTPVEVPDPPRHLAGSWDAVRADQRGERLLGDLLTDDEARLLPERFLAEVCISRSPSQAWLWQQLDEVLGEENAETRTALRGEWAQWPELVEPARFVGRHLSVVDVDPVDPVDPGVR